MTKSSRLLQIFNAEGMPSKSMIHERIHRGEVYSVNVFDQTLSNNNSLELLMVVGATAVHLRINMRAGGDAALYLYEDTTVSDPGTAEPSFNKNRRVTNPAQAVVTLGPTVISDGVLLESQLMPGGSGGISAGSQSSVFEEWILKPGSTYLSRFTNLSGVANATNLQLDFYEHSH
jgi:hypothetical protein